MNLANVKAFARIAKQTVIKHSPEILMCVGGVTFIATVVMASKETIDETEVLAEHDLALEEIEFDKDEGLLDTKAYKKSRMNVYKHTAIETAKNYAPSMILATTSLTCFFGAFGIMRKRYATLALAYSALEESFRKYRERVIEARGADEDIYYLTGVKPKEITVKNEDGTKEKKKVLTLVDSRFTSPYGFKFSKYNEDGSLNNQWSSESQSNISYILGQMDWLNSQLYLRNVFDDKHRVKIRGTVMLNELRHLLGEVPSPTGSIVGWRFGNGEIKSNGYIELNLVEAEEPDPDDPSTMIPCVFVNPNCDGMIYDLLGEKEKKPFEVNYQNLYGEDIRI